MTTRILPNRNWTDSNGTFVKDTIASVTDSQANVYIQKGMAQLVDQLPDYMPSDFSGTVPTWSTDSSGNPTGLVGPNGTAGYVDAGLFGASPSATAAVNTAAIQAALNKTGYVSIMLPGVYYISTGVTIPSNTTLYLGQGVIIRATPNNTFTNPYVYGTYYLSGLISNSNPSGGNVNISIIGEGTFDLNYSPTGGSNGTSQTAQDYYGSCITLDNVSGVHVGYGLKTANAARGLGLYGCTNFVVDDFTYNTSNTAGVTNCGDGCLGVWGNCHSGIVNNIKGTSSDDVLTINPVDIPSQTTAHSVGPISDITVTNIFADASYRSGSAVGLYGGVWPSNDSHAGAPPTITWIVNTSNLGLATATTSSAHGMSPGSHFQIASANPSGYNTTAANGNASNNIGTVVSVPDSTHFTYYVNSGTGSYVGSAIITIYYDCKDIVIDGVYGDYNSASVLLSGFDNTPYAVGSNIRIKNLSGKSGKGGGGYGEVTIDKFQAFGLFVDGMSSEVHYKAPAVYMINGAYLADYAEFAHAYPKQSYWNDTASGQAYFEMLGYDNLTIRDSAFKITRPYATGNYNVVQLQTAGTLFSMDNVSAVGTADQNMQLILATTMPSTMRLSNISTNSITRMLGIAGSNAGTYNVFIDGLRANNLGYNAVILNSIGSDTSGGTVNIQVDNVDIANDNGYAFIRQNSGASSHTNLTVGNFTSSGADPTAFLSGASSYGSGATLTVNGAQAHVDVSLLTKTDGHSVYNTNSALGTLGHAGVVNCQYDSVSTGLKWIRPTGITAGVAAFGTY